VGLSALPARLGRRRALALSALCHAVAAVMFLVVAWAGGLGAFYLTAIALAACLLAWEQSLISPRDLSRLGAAFFTANGWVSILIFAGGLTDLLMR
ncbi:MAG: 4-hydroxybenzoate octaprenyltransferase, partial [bacterium]|nr:4-hydroxybenzoate octaprenyltransferase [bacterium]